MISNNNKSITSKVNEVTQTLITELSGKNQTFNKKVIDNIFSFVGLAGGVGTSTIVSNVAKALVDKHFSTVIIDLNICAPVHQVYLKVEQKAKKPDIVSLLSGENSLGDSIEIRDGIALLYANNRVLFDKVAMDTPGASANLTAVIEQLSSLFDVVLIDIPAHGELNFELTNTALFKSDFIIAVMDENIECIGAYNRLQRNLTYVGISIQNLKVILNKRTNITYPANVFKSLEIDLDVLLPYEISVVEAGLRGNIYVSKGASSSVTAAQFLESIYELRTILLRYGGYEEKKMAEVSEIKPVKEKKSKHRKSKKEVQEIQEEIVEDELDDDSDDNDLDEE